ncbi:MAG: hypothetical protein LBQ77_07045 [Treponema sp.]|jgi:hypothetical protein|nr:hypothetical protein [Treponema sp.]
MVCSVVLQLRSHGANNQFESRELNVLLLLFWFRIPIKSSKTYVKRAALQWLTLYTAFFPYRLLSFRFADRCGCSFNDCMHTFASRLLTKHSYILDPIGFHIGIESSSLLEFKAILFQNLIKRRARI